MTTATVPTIRSQSGETIYADNYVRFQLGSAGPIRTGRVTAIAPSGDKAWISELDSYGRLLDPNYVPAYMILGLLTDNGELDPYVVVQEPRRSRSDNRIYSVRSVYDEFRPIAEGLDLDEAIADAVAAEIRDDYPYEPRIPQLLAWWLKRAETDRLVTVAKTTGLASLAERRAPIDDELDRPLAEYIVDEWRETVGRELARRRDWHAENIDTISLRLDALEILHHRYWERELSNPVRMVFGGLDEILAANAADDLTPALSALSAEMREKLTSIEDPGGFRLKATTTIVDEHRSDWENREVEKILDPCTASTRDRLIGDVDAALIEIERYLSGLYEIAGRYRAICRKHSERDDYRAETHYRRRAMVVERMIRRLGFPESREDRS